MKTNSKTFEVCAFALLLLGAAGCQSMKTPTAQQPELLQLSGDLVVHDPSIIKDKGTYYIFCTGGGRRGGIIPIRRSTDLHKWATCGYVFTGLPAWVADEVPLARGIWAPDISYLNGKYHLYYAVSSFGVNKSAIGLAINETLDPTSPRYKWVDQGLVLRSQPSLDDFNAIDPNLVIEDPRHVWLCWGSFWGGIKLRQLDPDTGKLSTTDTHLYSLASRPRLKTPQTPPVEGAVEGPTIMRHGDYWYLFASYDFCCRGTNSTYNVKVGRSRNITGPYLDRTGKSLAEDGGTPVIQASTQDWHGAGGEAVLTENGRNYMVFHAYNPKAGWPRLEISTIVWEDGWPQVANRP